MSQVIRLGWCVAAALIAAVRLYGVTNLVFQATAHLVVGGFFGAWLIGKAIEYELGARLRVNFYGVLGILLTVVETCAFLMGIGR
jgi:hypothetical protein